MSKILRGQLVNVDANAERVTCETNGAVVVDDTGRIAWRGDFALLPPQYRDFQTDDHGEHLLLPGFIDAHIHFPQYRMLAAPAADLLHWLNTYTFPEESRYSDKTYGDAAAQVFLKRLFSNGTTSVLAFCSVHKQCATALFAAASTFNMALTTGKTLMDRNAIPAVLDTPEAGARESAELYGMWHNKGRLRYAVTPRFAVTSTEAQLAAAGELMQSLSGAVLQTHISESAAEIALVSKLFPNARDYTDVYDQFGLLTPRSVFAHGIHLSERERRRLHETDGTIVHCPTSNSFLGSGIMPMKVLRDERVHLALATDIGGGTSYSMLATMAEAYKLQMLTGYRPTVRELYHLATLGNAKRLKIGHETGSLEVGKFADVVVLNPKATEILKLRHELSTSIEDVLFALMMLGDDRAVAATYVAGHVVYSSAKV
jgi:guanine deaminase